MANKDEFIPLGESDKTIELYCSWRKTGRKSGFGEWCIKQGRDKQALDEIAFLDGLRDLDSVKQELEIHARIMKLKEIQNV